MTVRILFRKPYGPLKCNKIILNIMIIWTITQPVISWEFFKISFLQIIINYSTNSEKKTENWCFDWALICDFPFTLAVVLCSSLAELRTSGSEAAFPSIKSHSPSTQFLCTYRCLFALAISFSPLFNPSDDSRS